MLIARTLQIKSNARVMVDVSLSLSLSHTHTHTHSAGKRPSIKNIYMTLY